VQISGTVFAPGGHLAQGRTSVLQYVASLIREEALALTGNVSAAGGVAVTLSWHHADGTVDDNLANAVTNDQGQYQLSLPPNTTEDTIRFMVSAGSGGNTTRAFVTSHTQAVDIDFVSETVVRLILGGTNAGPCGMNPSTAGFDLAAFSSTEIRGIEAAVRQLPGSITGSSAAQLNCEAYSQAAQDPGIISLLNEAAGTVPTPTPTSALPTATATPTPTPTNTATPTITPTPTPPPTATKTPTVPPTVTPRLTNTATDTPTNTPTPTDTPTKTALPTSTPQPCVGDCDGSGEVTVNELIIMVNIALGTGQPSACPNGIPSGGSVDIALIIQAVNNALNGCGGA
jgi:hypothetical protein